MPYFHEILWIYIHLALCSTNSVTVTSPLSLWFHRYVITWWNVQRLVCATTKRMKTRWFRHVISKTVLARSLALSLFLFLVSNWEYAVRDPSNRCFWPRHYSSRPSPHYGWRQFIYSVPLSFLLSHRCPARRLHELGSRRRLGLAEYLGECYATANALCPCGV